MYLTRCFGSISVIFGDVLLFIPLNLLSSRSIYIHLVSLHPNKSNSVFVAASRANWFTVKQNRMIRFSNTWGFEKSSYNTLDWQIHPYHMLEITLMTIVCEIATVNCNRTPLNDKSTLIRVMAFCYQTTCHYLGHYWPWFMSQIWRH